MFSVILGVLKFRVPTKIKGFLFFRFQGTQATKCLYFKSWNLNAEIAVKGLAKMKDLRFIQIEHYFEGNILQFDKVSEYLPSSLQFMKWDWFPFSSLPNTFQGKNLVELELYHSNIVQLWEDGEGKVLHKLRFLTFDNCSKLQTFDLRLAPNLEQLTIHYCQDFRELQRASTLNIVQLWEDGEGKVLHKLRFLSIWFSELRTFDLRLAPNLEQLTILRCDDFVELHMPAESLKLQELNLSHSKLRTLDLWLTPNLEYLDLENCYELVEINAPVGCLKKLVFLDLSGCGRFKSFVFNKRYQPAEAGSLSELHLIAEPTDFCPLHSDNDSPKFRFECYYKEDPASSFGNLERLISIGLCGCTNLESFSRSICSLQCIRKLTLEGSIPEAPKNLDHLECLEELTLSSTNIEILPDRICMLRHLKRLEIISCCHLEKLPDDIGQLECLETLILMECILLRDIPNSICNIRSLKQLRLRFCTGIETLPEDIGRLECLRELNIARTGITHLPWSVFQLKGLCIVTSSETSEYDVWYI